MSTPVCVHGDLLVELGRRCNMCCPHCLRGNAQDVSISRETIDRVLDSVKHIGSIVFSGGEPMLYGDMIAYIVDQLIARHIEVGAFYMATNGKYIDKQVLLKLAELYVYCDERDMCAVEVSSDVFHEDIPDGNVDFLEAFSFYRGERGENANPDSMLHEGRAIENGIGTRTVDSSPKPFEAYEIGDEVIVEEIVYVNALGELFPDCDFSYETQSEYGAWNVSEKELADILLHFNSNGRRTKVA